MKQSFFRSYTFSIILVASISFGALLGVLLQEKSVLLKPFGDVFLNLLFTSVVPLVFFSISSAVAGITNAERLKKIMLYMVLIFAATGIISSLIMVIAVKIYPPAQGLHIALPNANVEKIRVSEAIVKAFTAPDFSDILSKKNMLALIIFSLLLGLGAAKAGEKAKPFIHFLEAGSEVMMKVISIIMLYAPVGLAAYFAYLVGTFGPQLLGTYVRVAALYYPLALLYFFFGFSFYTYLSGGKEAIKTFWSNIIPPALTAWATGSSVATIPANLEAARRFGVPKDIREVVIPIGATIHMDGSCLSAILKIALLFGIFGMNFSGPLTLLTAVGIALLSGTVMAGIPGGGFIGEMLIVTLYGFPVEALPIISMVGTIVDPPATMVNSTGDTVASMFLARVLNGKKWMKEGNRAQ